MYCKYSTIAFCKKLYTCVYKNIGHIIGYLVLWITFKNFGNIKSIAHMSDILRKQIKTKMRFMTLAPVFRNSNHCESSQVRMR